MKKLVLFLFVASIWSSQILAQEVDTVYVAKKVVVIEREEVEVIVVDNPSYYGYSDYSPYYSPYYINYYHYPRSYYRGYYNNHNNYYGGHHRNYYRNNNGGGYHSPSYRSGGGGYRSPGYRSGGGYRR